VEEKNSKKNFKPLVILVFVFVMMVLTNEFLLGFFRKESKSWININLFVEIIVWFDPKIGWSDEILVVENRICMSICIIGGIVIAIIENRVGGIVIENGIWVGGIVIENRIRIGIENRIWNAGIVIENRICIGGNIIENRICIVVILVAEDWICCILVAEDWICRILVTENRSCCIVGSYVRVANEMWVYRVQSGFLI